MDQQAALPRSNSMAPPSQGSEALNWMVKPALPPGDQIVEMLDLQPGEAVGAGCDDQRQSLPLGQCTVLPLLDPRRQRLRGDVPDA
ncbi:hypothetical protein [Kitasatospora sp. NPDC085879]|uniref:hypothetical protein n=1 Tax=Kitasatospora sp. NPDC085879 TaxID=3154769 RepID=UPI000BB0E751|nr:hypothetical protein [Streptomyces sp. TLI_235]